MEAYVTTRVYELLFCRSSDEKLADLSLQGRIRSLNWVTAGFLDSGLKLHTPSVQDKGEDAITGTTSVHPVLALSVARKSTKLSAEVLSQRF